MQLTQTQFKILILIIGAVLGLALSFLIFAMTHSPAAFIFVPITMVLVYFQQVHPIGRRD